jgi:flavodoxin
MKSKLLDEVKDLSFVVLYGSQLGQAESIAESIAEKAPEYDFTAQAFPLNAVADIVSFESSNHSKKQS